MSFEKRSSSDERIEEYLENLSDMISKKIQPECKSLNIQTETQTFPRQLSNPNRILNEPIEQFRALPNCSSLPSLNISLSQPLPFQASSDHTTTFPHCSLTLTVPIRNGATPSNNHKRNTRAIRNQTTQPNSNQDLSTPTSCDSTASINKTATDQTSSSTLLDLIDVVAADENGNSDQSKPEKKSNNIESVEANNPTTSSQSVVRRPSTNQNMNTRVAVRPSNPVAEPEEYSGLVWLVWRCWLAFKIILISVMFGFTLWALLQDSAGNACDTKIFKFSIAHFVFLSVQLLSCFGLLLSLPWQSRRWTWNNFARLNLSKVIWGISSVTLIGQVSFIPIGFALIKNSLANCNKDPTPTFDVLYYCLLVQSVIFVLVGLPAFCLPCIWAFFDVPRSHGVSSMTFNRMTTIVYDASTTTMNDTAPTQPIQSITRHNPFFWRNQRDTAQARSEIQRILVYCDRCIVCMELWEEGSRIKKLTCNHVFHEDCIKGWLDEHSE
ncbi:hypothetical protein HK096_005849, partial [Nowakowskiella sp. JEL0078]